MINIVIIWIFRFKKGRFGSAAEALQSLSDDLGIPYLGFSEYCCS